VRDAVRARPASGRVTASVSVTVDVDGEAGLPDGGRAYARRLSGRSERRYGVRRGLPRILDVLAELEVEASFYVPGIVAQRHPDEVRAIVGAGHELGHHGHRHLAPARLSPTQQLVELHEGRSALEQVAGPVVHGYRAPEWELAPTTLAALADHGFSHDSSLMDDDRPYRLRSGGGEIVELPVHWTLDDAPHFAHTTDPRALLDVWAAELRCAAEEGRAITYTLHPDILGRPHRLDVLRRLLGAIRDVGVPVLPHGAVARSVMAEPDPRQGRGEGDDGGGEHPRHARR
jgi:peptidoglycan/xylan/chitin deacetylase (PgdA/CDA1 family)